LISGVLTDVETWVNSLSEYSRKANVLVKDSRNQVSRQGSKKERLALTTNDIDVNRAAQILREKELP